MSTPSAFVDADTAQAAAASAPPGTLLKPTNTPGHVPPPANLNITTHQPGPQDTAAAPEPLASKPIIPPTEEAPPGEETATATAAETKPPGEKPADTFQSKNPMDIAKGFEEALANTEPDDDGTAPKPKPAAKKEEKKEEKKETPPGLVPAAGTAAPAPTASELDAKLKAAEGLLHPNIGSGTKKGIEAMRAAYQAEITALKATADKATALETKAKELEAKLSAGPSELPEAVKKELDDLRQFRREADVTKDPEFVAKYDGKINANTAKVEAMLTAIGKAHGHDEAMVSKTLALYKKSGYTLDNLAGEIQELQKAGQFGQAQRLTALLMQNEELTEGKSAEIAEWQKDATGRTAAQQAAQTQQNARIGELTRATYAQTIAAETEIYAKDFPFIKAPPAPAETDAPAVKQAKTEAQAFYNEAMGKAKAALDEFVAPLNNPDQVAVRNGKLYAMAAAGLTFKNLIAPKMAQEMASMRAELETLRAKVTSTKKAGDLSARHAVEATGGSKVPVNKGLSTAEAFAAGLEATANQ